MTDAVFKMLGSTNKTVKRMVVNRRSNILRIIANDCPIDKWCVESSEPCYFFCGMSEHTIYCGYDKGLTNP